VCERERERERERLPRSSSRGEDLQGITAA